MTQTHFVHHRRRDLKFNVYVIKYKSKIICFLIGYGAGEPFRFISIPTQLSTAKHGQCTITHGITINNDINDITSCVTNCNNSKPCKFLAEKAKT